MKYFIIGLLIDILAIWILYWIISIIGFILGAHDKPTLGLVVFAVMMTEVGKGIYESGKDFMRRKGNNESKQRSC
jgi:ABC-type bacteriocin/lantibiotic exporter with double-glycine peptidase domain